MCGKKIKNSRLFPFTDATHEKIKSEQRAERVCVPSCVLRGQIFPAPEKGGAQMCAHHDAGSQGRNSWKCAGAIKISLFAVPTLIFGETRFDIFSQSETPQKILVSPGFSLGPCHKIGDCTACLMRKTFADFNTTINPNQKYIDKGGAIKVRVTRRQRAEYTSSLFSGIKLLKCRGIGLFHKKRRVPHCEWEPFHFYWQRARRPPRASDNARIPSGQVQSAHRAHMRPQAGGIGASGNQSDCCCCVCLVAGCGEKPINHQHAADCHSHFPFIQHSSSSQPARGTCALRRCSQSSFSFHSRCSRTEHHNSLSSWNFSRYWGPAMMQDSTFSLRKTFVSSCFSFFNDTF